MTELFAALAERLAKVVLAEPERWIEGPLTDAAVLVPLSLNGQGEIEVTLIERAAGLRTHAGQIAFPGGAVAEGDVDRIATALREAEEEIGLPPTSCRILGRLGALVLPSRFEVTPIVAAIPDGQRLVPAPGEVARILRLPLHGFLAPSALEVTYREAFGKRFPILFYRLAGEEVWGATARIVEELLTVAGPLL